MDTKTAFEILDLDATATLEAAKKAYRDLAKKYHPDVVEKNSLPAWKAEAKMKDINLAFRCLAPLLKAKEPVKRTKDPETGSKTDTKSAISSEKAIPGSFLSRVAGFFINFFHTETVQEPFQRETKKEQPGEKTIDKKVHFEDIFKRFHTGIPEGKEKTKRTRRKKHSQANNSFNDYHAYMKLKQKMKSGQLRRHQGTSIGRVTKIEPITPVNPVGKQ